MLSQRRITPGPGQESVWDYPRPPALEDSSKRIKIVFNDTVIVDSQQTKRVLETSHPPVYYIPTADIAMDCLSEAAGTSFCEWKGRARYYTVTVGDRVAERVAWCYPTPTERFASIADYVAFYPSAMDTCYVDDEQVQAQTGDFYGGWITSDIVGPFKGGAGTWGW
ncbi:MAG: DUF427 domain-containing protein [Cyanobacteria bacterium P01_H01_bin.21]